METRKTLYLTLVRSKLTYCSQVWRPQYIKDIVKLEQVQRRATRFILGGDTLSYKNRLLKLQILPLMMWFEMADIMFFVRQIKTPTKNFQLSSKLIFASCRTRSSSQHKLSHSRSNTNRAAHFYFNRFPRLWNRLPPIDIEQSTNLIHNKLVSYFWSHFRSHFSSDNPCTYHFLCPCARCSSSPQPSTFN